MARTLNHATHGTVQGWWERDVIPAHRQASILEAATTVGIELKPSELIPGFDGRGRSELGQAA